jgi:hypothetical protein
MKFGLIKQMGMSKDIYAQMGIDMGDDNQQDLMKRMFLEANPILLAVTMVVNVLHMIFEFLAVKNDF